MNNLRVQLLNIQVPVLIDSYRPTILRDYQYNNTASHDNHASSAPTQDRNSYIFSKIRT
jgi:hypothetical protein